MSRWRASGYHFLISIAVGAAALVLMLLVWYPWPLFEACGGNELVLILMGVDIVLGPLCTLVVFRSGKRGLKLDLAIIGVLQFSALVYGAYVVSLARPAYIVFVKDRFEIATVADLDAGELAKARFPQFASPPLDGPMLAYAQIPDDENERNRLVELGLVGYDLHQFPKYWAPYETGVKEILAAALTPAALRSREPELARALDKWIADSGTPEAQVRCLLMKARNAWLVAIIDPVTARPARMLIAQKL